MPRGSIAPDHAAGDRASPTGSGKTAVLIAAAFVLRDEDGKIYDVTRALPIER
jgi:hypothetical protein